MIDGFVLIFLVSYGLRIVSNCVSVPWCSYGRVWNVIGSHCLEECCTRVMLVLVEWGFELAIFVQRGAKSESDSPRDNPGIPDQRSPLDIAMEFYHRAVKSIALMCLIALQCACTTPTTDQYNRRDLYSPEPEPGSAEVTRQLRPHPSPTAIVKPEFR